MAMAMRTILRISRFEVNQSTVPYGYGGALELSLEPCIFHEAPYSFSK
jgi:hypothetical protein